MNRRLWSVLIDHRPVAVVAADHSDEAWKIVLALAEFDDLPSRNMHDFGLQPCSTKTAGKTFNRARELGVENNFLACLREGMFLIEIGLLTATKASTTLGQVA